MKTATSQHHHCLLMSNLAGLRVIHHHPHDDSLQIVEAGAKKTKLKTYYHLSRPSLAIFFKNRIEVLFAEHFNTFSLYITFPVTCRKCNIQLVSAITCEVCFRFPSHALTHLSVWLLCLSIKKHLNPQNTYRKLLIPAHRPMKENQNGRQSFYGFAPGPVADHSTRRPNRRFRSR